MNKKNAAGILLHFANFGGHHFGFTTRVAAFTMTACGKMLAEEGLKNINLIQKEQLSTVAIENLQGQ